MHSIVVGRDAMACRFEVVFNAGETADATELGVAALDLVDLIEDRITVYRDGSELMRLNATASEGWQPVAADLFELLVMARQLSERTGGGFDCASGALVRAWGFLERRGRIPTDEALQAARERSGMRLVELDPATKRVRFVRPGVELNLGGIGKGWALDRVVELLRDAGVESLFVHGGRSSVRTIGAQGGIQGGRRGWPVGVRHPLRTDRRLATIRLEDRALGTSGSGTQFFVDRGRRLGHILDPRSGLPAEGVLSATVVAPTAAESDALSTALYVLGPAGLPLIAPPGGGVGGLIVVPAETPGRLRVIVANLDAGDIALEPGPDVEVELLRPIPAAE